MDEHWNGRDRHPNLRQMQTGERETEMTMKTWAGDTEMWKRQ